MAATAPASVVYDTTGKTTFEDASGRSRRLPPVPPMSKEWAFDTAPRTANDMRGAGLESRARILGTRAFATVMAAKRVRACTAGAMVGFVLCMSRGLCALGL